MLIKILLIDKLEDLLIIADPLRLKIYQHLKTEAISPMRLSYSFKVSAQKLTYHFTLLQKHGFIYKKFEQKKRGSIESSYMAMAYELRIHANLFNESSSFVNFDQTHLEQINKINEIPIK